MLLLSEFRQASVPSARTQSTDVLSALGSRVESWIPVPARVILRTLRRGRPGHVGEVRVGSYILILRPSWTDEAGTG